MTVQNQAVSSSNGQLYTWVTASPDWAASSFPGPGTALHIAVAMAPATAGGGGGVTVHGALLGLNNDDHASLYALFRRPIQAYTGASNDFALADTRKFVTASHGSNHVLRIRLQSALTWVTADELGGANVGAGTLTITGEAGVTINGTVTVPPNGWFWLKRTAPNTWQCFVGGTGGGGGGDIKSDGSVPYIGNQSLGGNKITNAANGTPGSQDLAPVAQVEALIRVAAPPAPALVATSNITPSGVQVIDGVSTDTIDGDVLLAGQTTPAQGGYWTPNDSGAWARPSYYDSDADVAAALGQAGAAVLGGTLGAGSVWFQSAGTTLAGSKTWTKLATPSLLQDARATTLPAQTRTQYKGAAIRRDPSNGRNVVDLGRADPAEYGALAITTETTGTCTVGSAITLAAENGHENGSWLFVHGAGPDHGMATPAAPTAVVQGTPGSTQWEFVVVAMTRSYGYTAASPVCNVTNGPATLTDTTYTIANGAITSYTPGNFIELFFAPVPGAMWYLVYARTGGTGAYLFKGAALAYPASYYHDVAASFRFVSSATRGVPSGIPSTPPVAARANGLRTQVISGGRTTVLTVKPTPYTAATGTVVEHCAMIPIEDAMNAVSGGAFGSRQGGEVVMTPGTYPITGDVRVTRSLTLRGVHNGRSSSSVVLQAKHGVQFGIDQGNMAPPRQPGELVRVGDRRQVANHGIGNTNYEYVMYCVAVTSADGTWGKTDPGGDPAWNMTDGATTVDGEVTWQTNGPGYYTNAFDAFVSGIFVDFVGTNGIPSGRTITLQDMRLSWRNYPDPGTGLFWGPGITVAANQVVMPSPGAAGRTGKMYIATVGGVTGASEPSWTRVNGATQAGDGGVTYVCYDQPHVQGAAVLATTVHHKRMAVRGAYGAAFVDNGDSGRGYAVNDSTTDVNAVSSYNGHSLYVFGSDAQQSTYRVNSKSVTRGLAYGDDSFYGSTAKIVSSGALIQNTPHPAQNVQTSAWLLNSYSESGPVDWNAPGRVCGGAGLQNQFGTAIFDGIASYESPRRFYVGAAAPYEGVFTLSGGYVGLESLAGVKGPPFTYYQSRGAYNLGATFKRIQNGLNSNNGSLLQPTEEEPQYDGRGFSRCYPPGLRAGAGRYAGSERFYLPVSAVPTVGAFATGDYLPWVADNRRLAIIPTRRGAEGYTSRANSTEYVQGQIVASASGGRLFACCNGTGTPGASAASEPAGMATAAIDTYVTDGTVLWQCVGTVQQSAALRAVPNWSADAVAVTDADHVTGGGLAGSDGPVFALAAASANRTIDVLTTGAMIGDGVEIRNAHDVAFAWTINSGSGGSAVIVLPVNTPCRVRLRYNGTAWTVDSVDAIAAAPRLNPIRLFSGTADGTTAADLQSNVISTGGSAVTFTANSHPDGYVTTVSQHGAGAIAFTAGSGVTFSGTPLSTSAPGQSRVLFYFSVSGTKYCRIT